MEVEDLLELASEAWKEAESFLLKNYAVRQAFLQCFAEVTQPEGVRVTVKGGKRILLAPHREGNAVEVGVARIPFYELENNFLKNHSRLELHFTQGKDLMAEPLKAVELYGVNGDLPESVVVLSVEKGLETLIGAYVPEKMVENEVLERNGFFRHLLEDALGRTHLYASRNFNDLKRKGLLEGEAKTRLVLRGGSYEECRDAFHKYFSARVGNHKTFI